MVINVLSSRLICLIDILNKVGIISVLIFIMFGLCYFYLGFINKLVWNKNGSWKFNCIILLINIFYVRVKVGLFMVGVSK